MSVLSVSSTASDLTSHRAVVDYCGTSPCRNEGTCINEMFRYRCICVDGYTGGVCEDDTGELLDRTPVTTACPANATD